MPVPLTIAPATEWQVAFSDEFGSIQHEPGFPERVNTQRWRRGI